MDVRAYAVIAKAAKAQAAKPLHTRPRGRKPGHVIVVPFTPEDYSMLMMAAAAAGKPLAEWLLGLGLEAAAMLLG